MTGHFDMDVTEESKELRLWGYSLKELCDMRDFALSHGWKLDGAVYCLGGPCGCGARIR